MGPKYCQQSVIVFSFNDTGEHAVQALSISTLDLGNKISDFALVFETLAHFLLINLECQFSLYFCQVEGLSCGLCFKITLAEL